MRLRCFPFRKSSHCESSQLPPPLTGPGPGLLNSHQSYYLIRHPIVAVSMSQNLHKIPVCCPLASSVIQYNEHLPEYSLWVLNGMAKYGVACQWGVCFIEWIWGSGQGLILLLIVPCVSSPLSPIHALLSPIKAHYCESKAIIIWMSLNSPMGGYCALVTHCCGQV